MLMVIDTETKAVVAEVPVAAGPMHIAVSSDGNNIYIPSMMGNVVTSSHFTMKGEWPL